MQSLYEQVLNRVALPGKKPKPIRVERWESWAMGNGKTQSQEGEATEHLKSTSPKVY